MMRLMMRLLTIACLCAAGLQIAIWSGLVSGWTTLVGSSLGDAATKLERATEPRSALTSPADPLNRDVAAAGEENRKLKEARRETSAAQSARAVADLAATREETRTLTARHREAEKKASDAVEKQVQERARAEALDRDLAAARQEIQTLKMRQSDGVQQVSAADQLLAQKGARVLAHERARAEALDRDLAATGQEIQTLETRQSDGAQQVSAVEQQLAQERARAEALDRDLAAARQEIQTLKVRQSDGAQQVSAAEQELAQERARAEALDRDLAAARREIQTLKVDQANAAQDASAGERARARERARGEALAGNLAAVREENRTTVRADAVADNTSVPRPEFPRNENDESALHNSNDPGPTGHTMATAVPSANTLAAVQQNRTPSEAETYDTHMVPADAIHPLDSNEIASSLRRGDALVASGDVAAARLVLRRAADAGDARAAMTLAGTYDPAILEKLGVHGVAPDLAMARGWYEKAKKFGATEATQRLELLASKQH
jgi:cell division protein FtsB